MEELKQKLSDVYVTLEDIEIKGKQSKIYAICLQTLEECVSIINQQETKKE